MLSEIRIQDFAIIDKLEVQLAPGFNVITGETGAGKSIIIDAVDMMLGGRADSDFIRAEKERAVVEGIFKLSPYLQAIIRPLLEAEGVEADPLDEIVFTRELRTNGRNICRLNGSTVNLQFYREVGQHLVDIHGQSEHLSLLRPREHLFLLDNYANLEGQRDDVAALVEELAGVRHEIEALVQDETALARRIDMLGYQLEEIRAVAPKVDEEEGLREESTRLANAEQLATLTAEAVRVLDSDDADVLSAVELLNQASAALLKVAKIDPALEEHATLAESLAVQAEELSHALRDYNEELEHNPARLNEVEDRLDALNRLKRKYGGTLETVLAHAQKAQEELDAITHSEARLAELRGVEENLLRRIGALGGQLSEARYAAAESLSHALETELEELRMEGSRFGVQLDQEDDPQGCYVGARRLKFDSTGFDHVEFIMAANRGEPLRPLVKVASGGETARLMLALKSVLSRADKTPTLIFDEIDQGIGGRIGSTVGQKLWRLSDEHQVLCVTHLAQLASFGDIHFKVTKTYRDDRTVTTITPLNDRARVDELAEMLGAETVSAKQSAHDILMLARQLKEGRGIQPALM
jgi:DNA repair protein RecN (Recombination protein N)